MGSLTGRDGASTQACPCGCAGGPEAGGALVAGHPPKGWIEPDGTRSGRGDWCPTSAKPTAPRGLAAGPTIGLGRRRARGRGVPGLATPQGSAGQREGAAAEPAPARAPLRPPDGLAAAGLTPPVGPAAQIAGLERARRGAPAEVPIEVAPGGYAPEEPSARVAQGTRPAGERQGSKSIRAPQVPSGSPPASGAGAPAATGQGALDQAGGFGPGVGQRGGAGGPDSAGQEKGEGGAEPEGSSPAPAEAAKQPEAPPAPEEGAKAGEPGEAPCDCECVCEPVPTTVSQQIALSPVGATSAVNVLQPPYFTQYAAPASQAAIVAGGVAAAVAFQGGRFVGLPTGSLGAQALSLRPPPLGLVRASLAGPALSHFVPGMWPGSAGAADEAEGHGPMVSDLLARLDPMGNPLVGPLQPLGGPRPPDAPAPPPDGEEDEDDDKDEGGGGKGQGLIAPPLDLEHVVAPFGSVPEAPPARQEPEPRFPPLRPGGTGPGYMAAAVLAPDVVAPRTRPEVLGSRSGDLRRTQGFAREDLARRLMGVPPRPVAKSVFGGTAEKLRARAAGLTTQGGFGSGRLTTEPEGGSRDASAGRPVPPGAVQSPAAALAEDFGPKGKPSVDKSGAGAGLGLLEPGGDLGSVTAPGSAASTASLGAPGGLAGRGSGDRGGGLDQEVEGLLPMPLAGGGSGEMGRRGGAGLSAPGAQAGLPPDGALPVLGGQPIALAEGVGQRGGGGGGSLSSAAAAGVQAKALRTELGAAGKALAQARRQLDKKQKAHAAQVAKAKELIARHLAKPADERTEGMMTREEAERITDAGALLAGGFAAPEEQREALQAQANYAALDEALEASSAEYQRLRATYLESNPTDGVERLKEEIDRQSSDAAGYRASRDAIVRDRHLDRVTASATAHSTRELDGARRSGDTAAADKALTGNLALHSGRLASLAALDQRQSQLEAEAKEAEAKRDQRQSQLDADAEENRFSAEKRRELNKLRRDEGRREKARAAMYASAAKAVLKAAAAVEKEARRLANSRDPDDRARAEALKSKAEGLKEQAQALKAASKEKPPPSAAQMAKHLHPKEPEAEKEPKNSKQPKKPKEEEPEQPPQIADDAGAPCAPSCTCDPPCPPGQTCKCVKKKAVVVPEGAGGGGGGAGGQGAAQGPLMPPGTFAPAKDEPPRVPPPAPAQGPPPGGHRYGGRVLAPEGGQANSVPPAANDPPKAPCVPGAQVRFLDAFPAGSTFGLQDGGEHYFIHDGNRLWRFDAVSSAIIRATLRRAAENRRELHVDALHRGLTELRIECLGPAPPELPEWLRTLRVLRSALGGYIEQVTGGLRAMLVALSDSFAELIRQIEALLAAGAKLLEGIGKLAGGFDEWVAQKIEAAVLAALNMLEDELSPEAMEKVLETLGKLATLLGPVLAVDNFVHQQGLELVKNVTGLTQNQVKGLIALVSILLLAGALLRGLSKLVRGLRGAVKRFRERPRAGARPSPGGNGRGNRSPATHGGIAEPKAVRRAQLARSVKEGEDVAVIGHTHDDYAGFADSIEGRRFRVPNADWKWHDNAKWVDEQIAARRPVLLVTDLDDIVPGSATFKEVQLFRAAGYTPSADGLRLVPPGVR